MSEPSSARLFKQIIFSGVCMCGHPYVRHHLSMVMNPEAAEVMGNYFPEECEFFGANEDGGKDENGHKHCDKFVDVANPDPEVIAFWKGTVR